MCLPSSRPVAVAFASAGAAEAIPVARGTIDSRTQCGRVPQLRRDRRRCGGCASGSGWIRRASLLAEGKPLEIVAGGARRQDSVANAFARVVDRADVVVIHDAARPFVSDETIRRTVAAAVESGAAIAAIAAHDTVKRAGANRIVTATLPREEIFLAQTPQAFRTSVLKEALALGRGRHRRSHARGTGGARCPDCRRRPAEPEDHDTGRSGDGRAPPWNLVSRERHDANRQRLRSPSSRGGTSA